MKYKRVEIVDVLGPDIIQIVLSLHDPSGKYSRHAGATMASLFENTTKNIEVHLLHDETLTELNKEKFIMLADNYKQKVAFHFLKIRNDIGGSKALNRVTKGTLFRLYLEEILALNRVIYLDTDIIVEMDIFNLWEENLHGFFLGGVDRDEYRNYVKKESFYIKLGFNEKEYFNAGVLLMDLKAIKEKISLKNRSFDFLKKYPWAPALDQDALNFIFKGNYKILDSKYNQIVNQYYTKNSIDFNGQKKIWHFAGGIKPWNMIQYPVDSLYWKYLMKTPWGSDMNSLIKCIEEMNYKYYPLEKSILDQRIGNRKSFLRNLIKRIIKELKGVI